MPGPHVHDKIPKQDQVRVSSLDSSHTIVALGECIALRDVQCSRNDHFEYHDRIFNWMEESYLENYFANKQHLLSHALDINECTLLRRF